MRPNEDDVIKKRGCAPSSVLIFTLRSSVTCIKSVETIFSDQLMCTAVTRQKNLQLSTHIKAGVKLKVGRSCDSK